MSGYNNYCLNVHESLPTPALDGETHIVKGCYNYYHYKCDGISDQGWGCGYRTLQTLCSWVKNELPSKNFPDVPSIHEIQETLVKVEDKPESFIGSRDWIGSYEVFIVLNMLYNIDSKIIYVPQGELRNYADKLVDHFSTYHSPGMMGGDQDCSSKGIFGIHRSSDKTYLLIVDPHFTGRAKSPEELQANGWVKWQEINDFVDSSFYNICLPQVKHLQV